MIQSDPILESQNQQTHNTKKRIPISITWDCVDWKNAQHPKIATFDGFATKNESFVAKNEKKNHDLGIRVLHCSIGSQFTLHRLTIHDLGIRFPSRL